MTKSANLKRVGVFLPSGLPGGAENLLLRISEYFKAQNYSVTLFVLSKKNILHIKTNFPFKLFYINTNSEVVGIIKMLKVLRKERLEPFDYIFSSHVHSNASVSLYRKLNLLKTKYHVARESTRVFQRFSGLKMLPFRIWYMLGYKAIDLIICQTELMKIELIKNVRQVNKQKVVVLQNPAPDINPRQPAVEKEVFEKNYIIAAGRLIPEKGFDILISCMPCILQQYPNLHLIILGEGTERIKLESQVKNLGISQNVSLKGWKANVYDYFKAAKVCVLSSRIEGFPNTLLQMMALNDSIVSTKCTDSIESIAGLHICETNNKQSMLNAILDALSSYNTPNRELFDKFLKDNNMENYISRILNLFNDEI